MESKDAVCYQSIISMWYLQILKEFLIHSLIIIIKILFWTLKVSLLNTNRKGIKCQKVAADFARQLWCKQDHNYNYQIVSNFSIFYITLFLHLIHISCQSIVVVVVVVVVVLEVCFLFALYLPAISIYFFIVSQFISTTFEAIFLVYSLISLYIYVII